MCVCDTLLTVNKEFFFVLTARGGGTLVAASANEALRQWSGYRVRTLTLRTCQL